MKHLILVLVGVLLHHNMLAQEPTPEIKRDAIGAPFIKFGANVGYSRMTGALPGNTIAEFKPYLESLTSGINFNANVTYFFLKKIGIGAFYQMFHSDGRYGDVTLRFPDKSIRNGLLSDDIYLHYLGLSFTRRLLMDNNSKAFYVMISAGCSLYTNDSYTIDYDKVKKYFPSEMLELGYDFNITKEIELGVKVSYLFNLFVRPESEENNTLYTNRLTYLGMDQLSASAGIRYHVNKFFRIRN